MRVETVHQVEFGAELPTFDPDTSLAAAGAFADAVGWGRGGRFKDHERARREGFSGALVPGIMAMGFLTSMIHRWSPTAHIVHIDTVFRAPLLADEPVRISGVVTDIDEATGVVQLDLTVRNPAGETRVFGTAEVRLPVASEAGQEHGRCSSAGSCTAPWDGAQSASAAWLAGTPSSTSACRAICAPACANWRRSGPMAPGRLSNASDFARVTDSRSQDAR